MKKTVNHKRPAALTALLLVIAMLCAFAGCSKEVDPKQAVHDAAGATMAEFEKISGQFESQQLMEELTAGKSHAELNLALSDANVGMDISDFYGTGLRMSADSDMEGRRAMGELGIDIGSQPFVTMQLFMDDAMLYAALPELFGDEVFGLNTETLSELVPEAGESANFNMFDLIESYYGADGYQLSEETMAGVAAAFAALEDASEYAAGDKWTVVTAAGSVECDTYTMTVPAEALRTFVGETLRTLASDDYVSLVMRSSLAADMSSSGQSYEEIIEQAITELDAALAEALTAPVAVNFYVADGLLHGVSCTLESGSIGITLEAYFGGGANIADCFELRMTGTEDGQEAVSIVIASAGSHVLADGQFTDSTSFTIEEAEQGMLMGMTMDSTVDADSGAYTVDLGFDFMDEYMTVAISGVMTTGENSVDVSIDALEIVYSGFSITLSGNYSVSAVDSVEFDVSGATMLADLTYDDITRLSNTLNENGYALVMDLVMSNPTLMTLFMGASY